jgi:hypothetical protein
VKHGAKNSQMLMGTENTLYKGKSLHIHRNNKIHILENQNGKYIRCFKSFIASKVCMSIEIIKITFQKIKTVSTLIAT